ncbi:MAG: efflux transporter outer membrane subunit [Thermonemataceae bacterium]
MKINRFFIWVLSLGITTCAVKKRNYTTPESKANVEESELAAEQDTIFQQSAVTAAWWSNFNDPLLDTLIARTRQRNLSINAAVANFFAARAVLRGTKYDRFPTVTLNANYTRQRLGENIFAQGSNLEFDQYNATFDAFWELNLFGRVTHRVKEAYAFEQVALADMQAVYVSLFAEVARVYVELRGAQYLLDIAERNVENQKETFELTARLARSGTNNTLDVARAEAQLENTRASIPTLQAQINTLTNTLNVLVGAVPGTLTSAITDKQPLPSLPDAVLVGESEALLRRRPDVFKAEQEVLQLVAQYNLTATDLYPRVTFNGSVGFSAINFSSLGQNRSFTYTLIPGISWAAFNLGRVKQQINQQDALAIAAVNRYEQVTLEALLEIKNTMAEYEQELKRRALLAKAFQKSKEAAQLAEDRFKAGLDSFLDYLSADRTLLEAEVALANSEIRTLTQLIALYKALGGGWEIVTDQELEEKFEQLKEQDSTLNK